ncbi:unnamed protein product, partial [Laminaria digitata]
TNRYDFLSLDHLLIEWRLQSAAAAGGGGGAGSSLASGEVQLLGLAPATSREVEIDELFVHVEARLRAGSAWAPEGHLVAWGCFPVAEFLPTGKKAPLP